MKIENELVEDKGMFFLEQDGHRTASLHYSLVGNDRLIIHHTEVSPSLAGKGIGKQLVDEAVAYARASHIKIVPVCSFAKSVFQKYTGYEDVL